MNSSMYFYGTIILIVIIVTCVAESKGFSMHVINIIIMQHSY